MWVWNNLFGYQIIFVGYQMFGGYQIIGWMGGWAVGSLPGTRRVAVPTIIIISCLLFLRILSHLRLGKYFWLNKLTMHVKKLLDIQQSYLTSCIDGGENFNCSFHVSIILQCS